MASVRASWTRSRSTSWSRTSPSAGSRSSPALQEALARGCTLRLLAGCYLGGTLPEALRDLHALAAPFPNARVRFVEEPDRHFHPKVYRIVGRDGSVSLFVGSSNLSRDALTGARDALEWNLALDDATAAALLDDARDRLDVLFAREGVPLDDAAIARWAQVARTFLPPATLLDAEEPTRPPVTPNAAQREALQALAQVRREGYSRALVVAATGVGKTILAALDSCEVVPRGGGRVLFVAHRQELLVQARAAFERVRGDEGTHGFVHQDEKSVHADHVYASVWSLDALSDDALRRFDYVVVDEAHHGAAKSYRRLLDIVRPRFVLGLTATPERLDGANIYALFDGVVAWERSLLEAIDHGWLVPFRYFGVPDPVDYRSLEWTGGALGYRAADLEAAMLDDARTARVLEALADPRHAGRATLVFCVSIAHAERTATALGETRRCASPAYTVGPVRPHARRRSETSSAVTSTRSWRSTCSTRASTSRRSIAWCSCGPPIRRRCSSSRSAADCVCTRVSARSRCSTSWAITAARTLVSRSSV